VCGRGGGGPPENAMGAGAGVWRCNAMWEMPAARRGEARRGRSEACVRACVRRQAVAFLVLLPCCLPGVVWVVCSVVLRFVFFSGRVFVWIWTTSSPLGLGTFWTICPAGAAGLGLLKHLPLWWSLAWQQRW
jgi:hypothetical protein